MSEETDRERALAQEQELAARVEELTRQLAEQPGEQTLLTARGAARGALAEQQAQDGRIDEARALLALAAEDFAAATTRNLASPTGWANQGAAWANRAQLGVLTGEVDGASADLGRAAEVYARATELAAGDGQLWIALGRVLAGRAELLAVRGDTSAALALLEVATPASRKGVELLPQRPEGLLGLASADLLRGRLLGQGEERAQGLAALQQAIAGLRLLTERFGHNEQVEHLQTVAWEELAQVAETQWAAGEATATGAAGAGTGAAAGTTDWNPGIRSVVPLTTTRTEAVTPTMVAAAWVAVLRRAPSGPRLERARTAYDRLRPALERAGDPGGSGGQLCELLTALDPSCNEFASFNLAVQRWEEGDPQAALRQAEQALAQPEQTGPALALLAALLTAHGQGELAVSFVDRLLEERGEEVGPEHEALALLPCAAAAAEERGRLAVLDRLLTLLERLQPAIERESLFCDLIDTVTALLALLGEGPDPGSAGTQLGAWRERATMTVRESVSRWRMARALADPDDDPAEELEGMSPSGARETLDYNARLSWERSRRYLP